MADKPALVRVKRRRQDDAAEDLGTVLSSRLPFCSSAGVQTVAACGIRSVGGFGENSSSSFWSCRCTGSFGTLSSSTEKAKVQAYDHCEQQPYCCR